ncbi:MAG: hypothetical protein HRT89_05840 [Lentisphaeria bacterium]|nr:hypothetical protein [Lentisphaeria bacterium]
MLTVFSVLVHVSVSISYSTVKSRQRYIISPLAALIASLLVGTSSFLFNKDISGFSYSDAFLTLGIVLTVISFASLGIRINKSSDEDAIQFDLQTSEN